MLSRQDRRQVILMYCVGFIVLIIACAMIYRVIYEPLRNELLQLHQQLSDETPSSLDSVATVGSLGEYDQWMSPLHISQQKLRHLVVGMVEATHVNLQEIRFDEKKLVKPFYELPVFIKVKGSFPRLMSFFTALANSHLIFNFQGISLNKSSAAILAAIHINLRTLE